MAGYAQLAIGVVQAIQQYRQGKQTEKQLALQSHVADQQATADEETQRRTNKLFLGRQAASIAEAGLGYEGSTGLIADQSADFAELDALNTRYQGRMRAFGLLSEGRQAGARGTALAGQQLLSTAGNYYSSGYSMPSFSRDTPQSRRIKWNASGGTPAAVDPLRGT